MIGAPLGMAVCLLLNDRMSICWPVQSQGEPCPPVHSQAHTSPCNPAGPSREIAQGWKHCFPPPTPDQLKVIFLVQGVSLKRNGKLMGHITQIAAVSLPLLPALPAPPWVCWGQCLNFAFLKVFWGTSTFLKKSGSCGQKVLEAIRQIKLNRVRVFNVLSAL